MYQIGEFSKMSRTTIKTLRYYDEIGLLHPAQVNPENGYRYYTTGQLIPLQRIRSLRQAGLSVEEVQAVLNGADLNTILASRKAELEKQQSIIQNQLSRIEHILKLSKPFKEDFMMKFHADVKKIPSYTVFSAEGTLPNFTAFSQFIPGVYQEVKESNPTLKFLEPEYCFVSYLDEEHRETDIHLEYCQAVTKKGMETQRIKFKEMPAVTVVSVYLQGSYDGMGEAYAFAYNWIKENGYTQSASVRECYIDGVWNNQPIEKWLTEIQIPIIEK